MGRYDPRNLRECKCFTCGKTVYRYRSEIKGYVFCSRICFRIHQQKIKWLKENKGKPKSEVAKWLENWEKHIKENVI